MAALARYKAERQLKDMRARDANRAAEEKLAKAAAEKKRTAQKKANEGQAKHRKALRGKLGEDAYLAKQRATRQKNREKNRAREKKKKEDAEKKQNTNICLLGSPGAIQMLDNAPCRLPLGRCGNACKFL